MHGRTKLSIHHWGPAGWSLLHAVSFNYPEQPTEEERRDVYEYLLAFSRVLPCVKCRGHFAEMIKNDLPDGVHSARLDSRDDLSRLVVDWHNRVNERTHRPLLAYEAVRRDYSPTEEDEASMRHRRMMIVLSVSAVALIAAGACYVRRRGETS